MNPPEQRQFSKAQIDRMVKEAKERYTPEEIAAAQAAFACMDCGVNTQEIREYYMLADALWNSLGEGFYNDKMLCIGCVEERLGRQLVTGDFKECWLNHDNVRVGSHRLKSRMGKTRRFSPK